MNWTSASLTRVVAAAASLAETGRVGWPGGPGWISTGAALPEDRHDAAANATRTPTPSSRVIAISDLELAGAVSEGLLIDPEFVEERQHQVRHWRVRRE